MMSPLNMPGLKNTTKAQGRYSKAANSKNDKAVDNAIKGEGSFGRIEKTLGNRQFVCRFYNGEHSVQLTAIPRGVFSAGGKVRVRISVGDIVLLDGLQDIKKKDIIVEIIGRLDKKQSQELFKAGKIHTSIYSPDEAKEDDIFDYADAHSDADADSDEAEVDIDAI